MSGDYACPRCTKVFAWGADDDSAVVDRQGANWKSCRENAHWKLSFHMQDVHPDHVMKCPRREESFGSNRLFPGGDYWHERDHHRVCSYCGSMHPDDFLAAVVAGHKIGPTDKGYKAYVDLPHPDPRGTRIISAITFEPDERSWGHGSWEKVTEENRHLLRESGWTGTDYLYMMRGENGPHIHAKFYFQHLDNRQRQRFNDLHNNGTMKLGEPGRFYVRPYFATVVGETPTDA